MNSNDYVYTPFYMNNTDGFKCIRICPKNDFHYDGHISRLLKLPDCLFETEEGMFDYDDCIEIDKIMKSLGIEYDEHLDAIWNSEFYDDAKTAVANI